MARTTGTIMCLIGAAIAFMGCNRSAISDFNRPKLSEANVPENLRSLIPLAQKWGIGDDALRDEFERQASEGEKDQLRQALQGKQKCIADWLSAFPEGGMSDEAVAFMYMTLAADEMGALLPPPD